MPKKITQLPAASALEGPEKLEIVQGGTSKQTTAQAIANLASGGGGGGDFLYTGASPATVTINGITAGDDLSILTITQILEKILAPIVTSVTSDSSTAKVDSNLITSDQT